MSLPQIQDERLSVQLPIFFDLLILRMILMIQFVFCEPSIYIHLDRKYLPAFLLPETIMYKNNIFWQLRKINIAA